MGLARYGVRQIHLLHRPAKNSIPVYEVLGSSQYLEASKGIVHSLFCESEECSEAYFSRLRSEGLKRTTKLSHRYLTCEILKSVVELLN